MQIVRWIVAATIFIALLLLSLQNSDKATLTFFHIATFEAPLIVVVFVAFAIGVSFGLLAGVMRSSRLKRQISKLRSEQRSAQDPTTGAHHASPVSGQGHGQVRGDAPHRGF